MATSEPVATPEDLRVVLDADPDTFNTDRAALTLRLAQDLCETIVSPLPAAARGVVIGVAMRVFVNPQQVHDIRIGSAGIGFGAGGAGTTGFGGVGGLYLSRADKSALRRLAGQGGAFNIDVLPTGTNEVQTLTINATAGTFKLAFAGVATVAIGFAPTASEVLAAIAGVPGIGAGNVVVTGAGPFAIEFVNAMATAPLPIMTANTASLTGVASVVETVRGVFAPGQNLPPWDRDYYSRRFW